MSVLFALYTFTLGVMTGVVLSRPWHCMAPCCVLPKKRRCEQCWFPAVGSDGVCPVCEKNGPLLTSRTDEAMRAYVQRSWGDVDDAENISPRNTCGHCGKDFFGHKRRVLCKVCQPVIPDA